LSEITGIKSGAPQQDQRQMDLMLDMFAAEVKRLNKAA